MQQISENISVISNGEPIPTVGVEEYFKIALLGSSDLSPYGVGDWQNKFIQGLVTITDPTNGILMYKSMKLLLMNCKSMGMNNDSLTYDNPEFIMKASSDLDYAMSSDVVFFNFLKKSTAQVPLLEFSTLSQNGKMIVRCPDEYCMYGYVRFMCERYHIPLLPGSSSTVLTILQTINSFIPKFTELQRFKLPE